jgi:hypothetical protein
MENSFYQLGNFSVSLNNSTYEFKHNSGPIEGNDNYEFFRVKIDGKPTWKFHLEEGYLNYRRGNDKISEKIFMLYSDTFCTDLYIRAKDIKFEKFEEIAKIVSYIRNK